MSRKALLLLSLTLTTLLAACGAAPASSWPGVSVLNDRAYVAFNTHVYAIDLANGKEVSRFPPAGASLGEVFFSDPGVSESVIVVGSEGPATSYSGALLGLDPANLNTVKWCVVFDEKAQQRLSAFNCKMTPDATKSILFGIAPAVDNRLIGGIALVDGVAYFGMANNKVYAVDAATGAYKWHVDTKHPVWAAPLVDDGTVYIASLDHTLYALNTADGSEKWQKDLGSSLAGTPVLSDGTLYIGTFGNEVHALDAATGDAKWSQPYKTTNWVWGGPTVADGVVYVTDLSGGVFAVNADTGAEKWKVTVLAPVRGSPAVADNVVFVGNKNGEFYRLDAATGAVLSKPEIPGSTKGQLVNTPVIVPERELVLMATYQGTNLLNAYDLAGNFKWPFAPTQ
ncbi:MAG: PQQ-binding-like beta-propeller repeat protein [Anaerolineales bacterium]